MNELIDLVETIADDMENHDDCPMCGALNEPLGTLGRLTHYQCRQCGWQWSEEGAKLRVSGQDY